MAKQQRRRPYKVVHLRGMRLWDVVSRHGDTEFDGLEREMAEAICEKLNKAYGRGRAEKLLGGRPRYDTGRIF